MNWESLQKSQNVAWSSQYDPKVGQTLWEQEFNDCLAWVNAQNLIPWHSHDNFSSPNCAFPLTSQTIYLVRIWEIIQSAGQQDSQDRSGVRVCKWYFGYRDNMLHQLLGYQTYLPSPQQRIRYHCLFMTNTQELSEFKDKLDLVN